MPQTTCLRRSQRTLALPSVFGQPDQTIQKRSGRRLYFQIAEPHLRSGTADLRRWVVAVCTGQCRPSRFRLSRRNLRSGRRRAL